MHVGINLWPQNVSWSEMRETALLVDRLGFDSLWCWDHFYPIQGDPKGANHEAWEILAGWGAITSKVQVGTLVSGVTHRHPAVLANMAATLDHITNGRAILGIGAAWNTVEHDAYGIPLGTPAQRSRRFSEGTRIMRSLLENEETTYAGRYYQVANARCEPKPVQKRLPIMIGGGGERSTLRTTARYADMWHGFGTPDQLAHKIEVLRKHCADVGRDPDEIVPFGGSWAFVREDRKVAEAHIAKVMERQRSDRAPNAIIGGPDDIAGRIAEYWKAGVKGFIIAFAPPYDTGSIERIALEVRPRLAQLIA